MERNIDVIAFGPHPDDVELHCAGTLMMMKRAGFSIGVMDLTRGELSTRGTLETRQAETDEASRILGLDVRENLDMADGNIENTPASRERVIRILRRYRPATIFLPYDIDRHPDHVNAVSLIREAMFFSGLARIVTELEGVEQRPHRPTQAFQYMMSHDFDPAFIIDFSEVFDVKMKAIRAYATQFFTGDVQSGPVTYISTPDFMESILARWKRLGFLVGGSYGEGFKSMQAFSPDIRSLVR